MPPRLIAVRHRVTGRKAVLAESALHLFPDYMKTPSQRRRERTPEATSPAATPAGDTQAAPSATLKEN